MQNSNMRSLRHLRASASPLLAVLLAALLLIGCSAVRLGYNNGETIAYWWLNSYVDFESEQKPALRKELLELFAWHRSTQLKAYVRFLRHAQDRVRGKLTPEVLLLDLDEAQKRMLLLADRAVPGLADLALSLNAEQIDNIEKKFESNIDDYRKDYLRGGVEQRQRYRFKKLMKQAEYWFGNFSDEQEDALRAMSDSRPLNNELVLRSRLRNQNELIAMLRKIQREKPGREVTMQMIRNYLVLVGQHFGVEEYQRYFYTAKVETVRLVAWMVNQATPNQKEHFMETTQQWIEDFQELSR
jgi:Family of unknown function (DUF6279)